VTLNPVLDRIYSIPGLALNGVFRATDLSIFAGGKGVNVARVWNTLGGSPIATGLLGGRTGAAIAERLADEAIDARFLPIAGESRLALALFNPDNRSEAVVNEIGPHVSEAEYAPFLEHLAGLLPGTEFLAISGSAPPGTPIRFYSEMVDIARSLGIRTAVDASGAALVEAVRARPFLIKPNREEAAALGAPIKSWDDAGNAARELSLRHGIDTVIVTGGPDGAVVASGDDIWSASAPTADVVSTLGSGDSMLAGYLWSICEGNDRADALRLGVACGSANATTVGAGRCPPDRIAQFSGRINVNKLA